METNREASIGPWVDAQLVRLRPEENWEPDATRAFQCFTERCVAIRTERRKSVRNAAVLATVSVLLLALAGLRILRLWTTPLSPLVDLGQVSAGMKIVTDGRESA